MLDPVYPFSQICIQELSKSQRRTCMWFSPTFTTVSPEISYISTLTFVYFFTTTFLKIYIFLKYILHELKQIFFCLFFFVYTAWHMGS